MTVLESRRSILPTVQATAVKAQTARKSLVAQGERLARSQDMGHTQIQNNYGYLAGSKVKPNENT